MNEQQAPTDQAIRKALDWAQYAEDFSAEQAPFVVKETVTFGRAYHVFVIGLCVALIVTCLHFLANAVRGLGPALDTGRGGAAAWWIVVLMAAAVVVFIACMAAADHAPRAFRSWLAPRLYVIETLSAMVRS